MITKQNMDTVLTECRGTVFSMSASFSGGSGFEYGPGDQLSRVRFLFPHS